MIALPRGIIAARRRGVVVSPYLTNLISYWKLEEASGTRADSHGSHNLTDNNTVTQAGGKSGNAAEFLRANQEYLSVASHANFTPGAGSFSFTLWVYPTHGSGVHGVLSKWNNNTTKQYCLYLGIAATRFPSFIVTSDGNSDNQLDWSSGLTQNAWSFVACVFDYGANTMKLSVNGATFVTKSHTGGIYSGGSDPFILGKDQSTTNGFTGRIDEVAFWKGRALTQVEVTDLYNSGTGKFYPSFS